jgi:RNA polymerase subunit RPABC4/transcription elongation factor Spt4
MRYCNQCHRITTGEPFFCNFCGRSYDVKLCPHRHPNPRNADICSQCGSRELSTPAPRTSLWIVPLVKLLTILPGLALVGISILFVFALVQALLTNQALLFQAVIAGLMLTFLWYLYTKLPHFLRQFISKLFKRSPRDDHHGH